MKKKIMIIIVSVALAALLTAGGIFAYSTYSKNKLTADVQSVSMLNWGYWGDEMETYGLVASAESQDVYVPAEQTVQEVFVTEGQEVAAGDPLLQFDMTSIGFQIEIKELEIQGIANNITAAQRELETLKNTTPTAPVPEQPSVPSEPTIPDVPEKTGDAYHYISAAAVAYDGDGSADKPLRFLCTEDAYVYGSFLNYLTSNSFVAVFEVREGDTLAGAIQTAWTVNGAALTEKNPETKWYITDGSQVLDNEPDMGGDIGEFVPDTGYTAEELVRAVADKEREIAALDLSKRTAELTLTQMKNQSADGMVYAAIPGIVKTVGDPENLPNDGSAFLSVVGSEGLYVQGGVSEFMLDKIEIGQEVTVTSLETGMMYMASITAIHDYPEDNGDMYGGRGNPNVSYYGYTAYIEEDSELKNGEYVGVMMNTGTSDDMTGAIILEKAYVRTEDGKSYVLKADETNHLVKQYVETGRMLYGSALEIKSGLTDADYIAFPYGKTAKEGVKVNREDSGMMR